MIEVSAIVLLMGLFTGTLPGHPSRSREENGSQSPLPAFRLPYKGNETKDGFFTIRQKISHRGPSGYGGPGQESVLFSGRIDPGREGFLLLPGPGLYSFTLVTPDTARPGEIRILRKEVATLPPDRFPVLIFSGLLIFSGAFFVRGLSGFLEGT